MLIIDLTNYRLSNDSFEGLSRIFKRIDCIHQIIGRKKNYRFLKTYLALIV